MSKNIFRIGQRDLTIDDIEHIINDNLARACPRGT